MGHKSTYCQEDKIERTELVRILEVNNLGGNERVNCFSCGQNGHYANICPYKKKPMDQSADQSTYDKDPNQSTNDLTNGGDASNFSYIHSI